MLFNFDTVSTLVNFDRFRNYWRRLRELGIRGIIKAGFGYLVNRLINIVTVPLQAYVIGISIFSALCILSQHGLVPTNLVIDSVNKYLSTGNIPGVLPALFLISLWVLFKQNIHHFNYIDDTKVRRQKAFSATIIQSIVLVFGLLGALAGFALKAFPEAITNQLLFMGLSSSMLAIGVIRDKIARWIVQFY